MKTLLIVWVVINNGVATHSVYSQNMPTLLACEAHAKIIMMDNAIQQYQCIEGYSLPVEEK